MGKYTEEKEAQVVWPIPKEGISYLNAVETVFAISETELSITIFEDNGNDYADNVYIDVYGEHGDIFFKSKLIDLIRNEIESHISLEDLHDEVEPQTWGEEDKKSQNNCSNITKNLYLLVMMARAYEKWEKKYHPMTWDEIKNCPLPATQDKNND